jgi:hypothetical protein
MSSDSASQRPPRTDVAVVALLAAASLLIHVGRLGFYSDDWDLLGSFALVPDQSAGGYFRALYAMPQVRMRPIQALYQALMYAAFGLHPLGYHLVNALVLLAGVLLLLLVLQELGVHRAIAVAVAILYAMLPHYTTARVWYAASQAPLSMALFLLSIYAALRAARGAVRHPWAWRVVSVASLVVSGLAYEVTLPLALVAPLLVWVHARRRSGSAGAPPGPLAGAGLPLLLVLAAGAVGAFKFFTSTRLAHTAQRGYLRGLLGQIAHIHLRVYGVAAPKTAWVALHRAPGTGSIVAACAIAGVAYLYLRRLVRADPLPAPGRLAGLVAAGGIVVLLGYAVFVTTRVSFSATGPSNRVAMAAAIGSALASVAAMGLVAVGVGGRRQAEVFAALAGASMAGALIISSALIEDWVRAYRREGEVLAAVERRFPRLAPGTSLLLDGVCPYIGPAIVFESPWDLRGALWVRYRDPSLRADVVTPNLTVGDDGIHTLLYGDEAIYPYERLVIFNYRTGSALPIPNADAARRYFAEDNPDRTNGCPPGRAGHGVRVF